MAERPSTSAAVPEPSPAARELLRAFRDHESPSADVREQGLAALQARLHDAAEPTPAANGRVYAFAKATLVTMAVAAAVLLAIKGVGAGVTALASQARQPASEAPYQGQVAADGGEVVTRGARGAASRGGGASMASDAPEPAATEVAAQQAGSGSPVDATPRAAAEQGAAPPRAEPADPSLREPASSRPSRPRASAEGYTADELEAELALFKRATEAKKAGRHAEGLAALREHAERFPRGILADERTVLKAELLCAAGRGNEAAALVEAFLRDHAGSALAGRMRNVCRE